MKSEVQEYIHKQCLWIANPEKKYCEAFPIGKIAPKKFSDNSGHTNIFFLNRLLYHPEMKRKLKDVLWEIAPKEGEFQIAGPETGAIPFMLLLQDMYHEKQQRHVNVFSVMKDRSPHGMFHMIEGTPNDLPVMFVDDMINTGSSINKAMYVVDKELKLLQYQVAMCIISKVSFDTSPLEIRAPFRGTDFNYTYNPETYWEPKDIQ